MQKIVHILLFTGIVLARPIEATPLREHLLQFIETIGTGYVEFDVNSAYYRVNYRLINENGENALKPYMYACRTYLKERQQPFLFRHMLDFSWDNPDYRFWENPKYRWYAIGTLGIIGTWYAVKTYWWYQKRQQLNRIEQNQTEILRNQKEILGLLKAQQPQNQT